MRYILILLIVAGLPLLGFWLGSRIARRGEFDQKLSRHERRELEARRDFMSELGAKAAEHAMLGDHFGVIVQGMLNDERTKWSNR